MYGAAARDLSLNIVKNQNVLFHVYFVKLPVIRAMTMSRGSSPISVLFKNSSLFQAGSHSKAKYHH